MRLVIARRASTGLLLPRMTTSAATCTAFAAAVAAEMGLPSSAIEPEVVEAADDAVVARVRTSLTGVRSTVAVFWPDGDADGDIVTSAADVDRVTDARAARLYGGTSERQAWDGRVRQAAWVLGARDVWPDGLPVTAVDRGDAEALHAEDQRRERRATRIRGEGEQFKQAHGW